MNQMSYIPFKKSFDQLIRKYLHIAEHKDNMNHTIH